jgi:hypothetical protein
MNETEKLLREMSEKMDKMLKLMALNAVKENQVEQEKINILDSLGFRPVEIASLLGKSPDNVRVQLLNMRKKKGKSEKESEKLEQQETNSSIVTEKEGKP